MLGLPLTLPPFIPTRFNWTLADMKIPSSKKLNPEQVIKVPLTSAVTFSADNVEISGEEVVNEKFNTKLCTVVSTLLLPC